MNTLVDTFEVHTTTAVDEWADSWEMPEPEPCLVVEEESPRGVGVESWRRARCWGDEAPTRRDR